MVQNTKRELTSSYRHSDLFGGIIHLIWTKVRPIWPHHGTMVGNDLVEYTFPPYSRQAFVTTIWLTVKNSPFTIPKNDVKPIIRQGFNLFNAIH